MYVRRDPKRLKDGTLRTYVSLAHNVWEETVTGSKRSKPVVFARLGAEEDLDLDRVASMRDALDRYLQQRLDRHATSGERPTEEAAATTRQAAPVLKVLASREYGMRVLVESAWKGLGLDKALNKLARRHDIQFDFERVVLGMVLNRLVDPKSKRACNEWLTQAAWFPEADEWQVQHFYRSLDLLELHEAELLEILKAAVRAQMEPEELELLLLDTTSSYFESDYDDVERAEIAEEWAAFERGEAHAPDFPQPQVVNQPPLRMRGHSKDKRPRLPQVVIGAVGTKGGRLLMHRVYSGNRNDQTVTQDLLADVLEEEPHSRPVVVMDSGMGGAPNLAAIDELPGEVDRISGVPLRKSKFAEERLLARPGRWKHHPTKHHFTVRVARVAADESPSGRPEFWIATRNRRAANRQRRKLDKQVARVKAILEKDDRLEDHNREVCKLLAHKTQKRFVKPSKNGRRLLLNRDRIRQERRRAGVKVIRSTVTDHDPMVSLGAYEALLEIEADFRTFKQPLRLRPMHHRTPHRIRAHILMCAMALACRQELEHRTGQRFELLADLFSPIKAVHLQQGKTRFWQRGEWPTEAIEVLRQLGVKVSSRTWGAERWEGM